MRRAGVHRAAMALTVVALGLAMVCEGVQARAESFDAMVPSDVVSFASLRDYTEFTTGLRATPYHELLQTPEIAALLDRGLGGGKGLLAELRNAAGMTRDELDALLHGEVAVALFRIRKPGDEIVFDKPKLAPLLLVDVGPSAAKARQALSRLIEAAGRIERITLAEEYFEGHAIHHFTRTRGAGKLGTEAHLGAVGNEHVYLSLEGGILAVLGGRSRGPLDQHLAARYSPGAAAPLRDLNLYRQVLKRVGADCDFVTFQQFEHRWADMMQRAGNLNRASGFEALGLFGLKAQGSGTRIEADGTYNDLYLVLPQPRTGVPSALEPGRKFTLRPPGFVGGKAALYAGFYLDGHGLWKTTMAAMAHFAPLVGALSDGILANPNADVHVENDIIGQLDNRWFAYVPGQEEAEAQRVEVVWGASVKGAERFRESFGQFVGLLQAFIPLQATLCNGRQIYHSEGGKIDLLGGLRVPAMAMSAVDDYVAFARRPEPIQQIIRDCDRKKSPLEDRKEYRDCLSHMLKRPTALLYVDHRRVGKQVWPALAGRLGGALPPYEAVAEYLSVQATTAKWDEGGLLLRTWIPYAEQTEPNGPVD